MKKYTLYLLLAALAPLFSSCEIIGDIFQAGVVGGVLITLLIIGGIIWLITRGRGKS
jgi:hypothetical protein